MNASLITTVFNEEKNINVFIDSVLGQSLRPAELIIVDAGSSDKTREIIRVRQKEVEDLKIHFKLLVKKGANRSFGRNMAIKNASKEIIAVSDVGCILEKDWLKNITKQFSYESTSVVAGYYLPVAKTIFQKCVAPFFCVMPDFIEKHKNKADFEFLPSSRSVAFQKKVWERVGGYPEELNYCEDLVFDQKIKRAGFKINFNSKAIVYWRQRDNLRSVFGQFYNYAVGDGKVFFSKYQTHSKRIIFLYVRYFIGLTFLIFGFVLNIFWKLLFFAIFAYFINEIISKYRYVKNIKAIFYLPLLKLTADIAVILGTIRGIVGG